MGAKRDQHADASLTSDRLNRKRIDEWIDWGLGKAAGSVLVLDGAFEAIVLADLLAFSPAVLSIGLGVPLIVGRMTLTKVIQLYSEQGSAGKSHD